MDTRLQAVESDMLELINLYKDLLWDRLSLNSDIV